MHHPFLTPPNTTDSYITSFGGLDRSPVCPENFFSDTFNTSSDSYPLLSVRDKRARLTVFNGRPSSLLTVNGITFTCGSSLYFNGILQYDNLIPDTKKQLVAMGSKLIVFPDGYYINTLSADQNGLCTEQGYITSKKTYNFSTYIAITPCDDSGIQPTVSSVPPDVESSSLWLDDTIYPNILKKYSPDTNEWVEIEATHTHIGMDNVHEYVTPGKLTEICGIDSWVDGISMITSVGEGYFTVNKKSEYFKAFEISADETVVFSSVLPRLDFVCEHQNRIFGCRYGIDNSGKFVNEIYASKLGDPGEWTAYSGLSTDSYAASCGSEGPFTGIASHLGYVVFFKENRIHRLFGTKPANYTLYEDLYPGVAIGSEGSLCLADGILYYLGNNGVYAYSGSSPTLISSKLGNEKLHDGVGGKSKNKYYLSVRNNSGDFELYTYDLRYSIWHKEDSVRYIFLSPLEGSLLGIKSSNDVFSLELLSSKEIPSLCKKLYDSSISYESSLKWSAESGYLGFFTDTNKFLSKLRIRLETGDNCSFTVFYKTDSSNMWHECGSIKGKKAGAYSLHFVPPRCDKIKLLIKGTGSCMIRSVSKTFEYAGEVM